MPTFDKLAFMNRALVATGNHLVTTDDGSPEYTAASFAFDRAFPLILYKHNWHFNSQLNPALNRVGASNYPGYTDIYAKPANCLFLIQAWDPTFAQWVLPVPSLEFGRRGARPPSFDYQIIGDQIHCVGPNGVACEYIQTENDAVNYPPGFIEAVGREMESLIYQSLNEDFEAAEATKKLAVEELQEAKVRNDAENPRKVLLKSNMLERRRARMLGSWF